MSQPFDFKLAAIDAHEMAAELHRLAAEVDDEGRQTRPGYAAQQPSHDATTLAINLTKAFIEFECETDYNYVNDNLEIAAQADRGSQSEGAYRSIVEYHYEAAGAHEAAIECLEDAAPWN